MQDSNSSKKSPGTLVVSNYGHDLSWLNDYDNPHVVYDRSDDPQKAAKDAGLTGKIVATQNIGYNLHDIFRYIIDEYDNLPEIVIFCKGNIFPRHISREKFEELKDRQLFTPLFDHKEHRPSFPVSMFSCDGFWSEQNNGTIIINPAEKSIQSKYFAVYDDLLRFIFANPIIPRYITFAPGANYVVPRQHILKYGINFYKNLLLFVSHCKLPTEAHLIERALYTIWMGNFAASKKMEQEISSDNFESVKSSASDVVDTATGNYNVRYEIRIKDFQPPHLYIPLTQRTLMNKPECSNLFSCNVDDFITAHNSLHEAQEYLGTEIIARINPGKFAEFIIDTVYSK